VEKGQTNWKIRGLMGL